MSLHHDQAGGSPRQATYFFCFAKEIGKKGDPMIAPSLRDGARAVDA